MNTTRTIKRNLSDVIRREVSLSIVELKLPFRPFYCKHLLTCFLHDVLILLKFFVVVNETIVPGRTGIAHYKSHCLIQPHRTFTKSPSHKNIILSVHPKNPARTKTFFSAPQNIFFYVQKDFSDRRTIFYRASQNIILHV